MATHSQIIDALESKLNLITTIGGDSLSPTIKSPIHWTTLDKQGKLPVFVLLSPDWETDRGPTDEARIGQMEEVLSIPVFSYVKETGATIITDLKSEVAEKVESVLQPDRRIGLGASGVKFAWLQSGRQLHETLTEFGIMRLTIRVINTYNA